MITLLFGVALLLLCYVLHKCKYNYWKKRGVPFSLPKPFVGNYEDYVFQRKTFAENAMDICLKHPNEPVIGTFFGPDPALLIQDPELVKLIMTKDIYYFNGRELTNQIHKEILTKNLFFNYGDTWKAMRQNLTPLFSSSKMKNMFYLIEQHAKDLEKYIDYEEEKSVQIRSIIARYTMDCICSCVFGINAKVLSNDDNNPFRKIAESIFTVKRYSGIKYIVRNFWPNLFYACGLRLLPEKVFTFFNAVLNKVFDDRNHQPSSRNDFVDFMLSIKNQQHVTGDKISNLKTRKPEKIYLKVDDEFMASNCFLFFVTGFDTSAGTAAFAIYELAKHPEMQDHIFKEIDDYLAKHGNKIEYDCITELPFLDQCIQETLRLYPVLPLLTREVYKDYILPNGLKVEKGMRIHIPVYHLQRSPKFFPDPDEFKPERFLPERAGEIVPYTYLPFGEGPRTCIGNRFARMMILPGLLTLLKKYRVELAPETPKKLTLEPRSLTSNTSEKILVHLIPRPGWEARVLS